MKTALTTLLIFTTTMLCAHSPWVHAQELMTEANSRLPSASSAAAATQRKEVSKSASKDGKLSVEELNEITNGYADRYMTYIVSGIQKIEQGNPNGDQRRLANQIQVTQVSSIYDIVTAADPLTQLFDLMVVVTLQAKKWIDDDEAEKVFGPRGVHLVQAQHKAREDIWRVAAKVMKPEQLEQLDYLIWDWYRKNRDVQVLSYVRFDDFAASRGKSMVSDVRTGSGFLAPIGDAKKAVDDVRLLAERAFYLGKRMPFMMQWHAKAAVSEVMDVPEIKQINESVNRVSTTVDRIPKDIANEREAILNSMGDPRFVNTLSQVRGTVQDSGKLAAGVTRATQTADGLLRQVKAVNLELQDTLKPMTKYLLNLSAESRETQMPSPLTLQATRKAPCSSRKR